MGELIVKVFQFMRDAITVDVSFEERTLRLFLQKIMNEVECPRSACINFQLL